VIKLGEPAYFERLAAAFDKASTLPTDSLRAEVDELFTKMHSDGTLSELSKKWYKDATGEPVIAGIQVIFSISFLRKNQIITIGNKGPHGRNLRRID
jgi:hypothetical protein